MTTFGATTLKERNVSNLPVKEPIDKLAKAHGRRAVILAKRVARLYAHNTFGSEVVAGELDCGIECHKQAAKAGYNNERIKLIALATRAARYEESADWCKRRNSGLAM